MPCIDPKWTISGEGICIACPVWTHAAGPKYGRFGEIFGRFLDAPIDGKFDGKVRRNHGLWDFPPGFWGFGFEDIQVWMGMGLGSPGWVEPKL